MSERPKEHGWKPCVAQATGGSNPPLSEEKSLVKGIYVISGNCTKVAPANLQ